MVFCIDLTKFICDIDFASGTKGATQMVDGGRSTLSFGLKYIFNCLLKTNSQNFSKLSLLYLIYLYILIFLDKINVMFKFSLLFVVISVRNLGWLDCSRSNYINLDSIIFLAPQNCNNIIITISTRGCLLNQITCFLQVDIFGITW